MPNPFAGLRPALEVIAQEAEILPATGQALEDLMRPDQDEVYDRIRTGIDDKILDVLIEAPNRSTYVPVPPLYRPEKHVYRYFLDGSARTYFRRRWPVSSTSCEAPVAMNLTRSPGRITPSKTLTYTMTPR